MIDAIEAREMLPRPTESTLAIAAPGEGIGNWAGAPSAAQAEDGSVLLAARIRTPQNRGGKIEIYRSISGIGFDTDPIFSVNKDMVDAESLERPWLMRTEAGNWRLYLSCATTDTKHWRVEMLEAEHPDGFDPGSRTVVMQEGLDEFGLKDPVIRQLGPKYWQAFVTAHPLDEPGEEDQMETWSGYSFDGVEWKWTNKRALTPYASNSRRERWYRRGTRLTALMHIGNTSMVGVLFDGRATADDNYEEQTGFAVGDLTSDDVQKLRIMAGVGPVRSRYGGGALRYAAYLQLNGGPYSGQDRMYYEMANNTGAHELRVENRGYTF